MTEINEITAIILAAGSSTRMGRPKLVLPWKDNTILGEVTSTLVKAGIQEIIIVIQKEQELLYNHIQQLSIDKPLRIVLNESFNSEDMLSSIRYGLKAIKPSFDAALIALGDQPQIQENVVRLICSEYFQTKAPIIIPSFHMQRGHPWLISRTLWPQLIKIKHPSTPHDFLEKYIEDVHYVLVDDPSILQDIDTPQDYEAHKPA